jgi:RNA polymerase sigma-70 factor (ECF subfamily)
VLQEAYVDALHRLEEYFEHPDVPFYVWLRFLVSQRILLVHRHHLGAKKRAIAQELSLEAAVGPRASSLSIAEELVASGSSPSRAASLAEWTQRLVAALESMEPADREVLVLRHVEQLSNVQVAALLKLESSTASKRYVRALRKLRGILGEPGLGGGSGESP